MKNKVKLLNIENNFQTKLENYNFFKLDCNLLKKSVSEAYLYGFVGTVSGFNAIDIYSDINLINATRKGINDACAKAKEFKIPIELRPLLFTSEKVSLLENNFRKFESFKEINFDVLELHVDFKDYDSFEKILKSTKNIFPNKSISLNLSRKILSNANIIEFIKIAGSFFKNNILIEVDGLNEYDSKLNDFNNTIQTISTADIINKQLKFNEIKFQKIPILLSGGTNTKTIELAVQCGVPFNGISLNINQLKILKDYKYQNLDIQENLEELNKTLKEYYPKI